MFRVALLLFFIPLVACRSSGGEPVPQDDVTELTLYGDSHARINEVVGIVAVLPDRYDQYQWTQLDGAPVALPDRHGPAISFRVSDPGLYRFRFQAGSDQGSISDEFVVTVADDGEPARAALRADRSVSAGGRTSLRFWLDDQAPVSAPRFRQVSGPAASLAYGSDPAIVYLTAPDVPGDRVLVFEASVDTAEGTFTDQARVVVRNRPPVTSPYFCAEDGANCATTTPLQEVRAYRRDSTYRPVLERCVYDNQLDGARLCRVSELPPLGRQGDLPTVERIMDRVLVSHDWMGERFEALLRDPETQADLHHLLRPVTAVVISSDLRPSFYWALTGAIYLDPRYLWLTPEERDLINEQPDARSGFGEDLPFRVVSRFLSDDGPMPALPAAGERVVISEDRLRPRLTNTLYHELAHANDYLPPSVLPFLDAELRIVDEVNRRAPVSATLPGGPRDTNLTQLARVRYYGDPITEAQKQLDPDQVADWFFADVTNDFYAYTTPREDLAMLFEEALTGFRLGYQRDLAVTDIDYIVRQGWRHRIAQTGVAERAGYVLDWIYPEQAPAIRAHMESLTPEPLCAGVPFVSSSPECAMPMAFPAPSEAFQYRPEPLEHFSPPLNVPRRLFD